MRTSINPLTGESFGIPDNLSDSKRIKEFLSFNENKRVIVVQGLGFVGSVMALVCANARSEDYAVIGVDQANEDNFWKIESINKGDFPLIASDSKIYEYFRSAKSNGNLLATFDPNVYSHTDVIIVDVNLDVKKESSEEGMLVGFEAQLDSFRAAIGTISDYCKKDCLILVETTVPPGTCEKIVVPIMNRGMRERGLQIDSYKLGHSYERVMPGPNYVDSIIEYPRVYSGKDGASADAVQQFLSTIIDTEKCKLTRLKTTNETEMAKVLENSYRAMNIAFMIEWSRFAEYAGVNLYAVIEAIKERSTHNNIMYPGIGVGGYCLTKDPLLASWASTSLFASNENLQMSIESVSRNDQMPKFALHRAQEIFGNLKGKRICLLGVSYRGDVGDTRFTPVADLKRRLENKGCEIFYHDPYVNFWQEEGIEIEQSLQNVLNAESDLIIICAGHSEYKKEETVSKLYKLEPTSIFDTIGILNAANLARLGEKHKVSVLGRGDKLD